MRKRLCVSLSLLLVTALAFMACASEPVSVPFSEPVTVASTAGAGLAVQKAPAGEAWEVEWEKLRSNARREGSLVVYSGAISTITVSSLSEAVTKKFGLRVEFIVGRPPEISQKLIMERRAGIYLGDVYIGGSTTALNSLKPAGVLAPLDNIILLPEVLDPKAWYLDGLRFTDRDHKLLPFLAFPSPAVSFNSNLVKPEEIKSYRDLLTPRFKGKIVLNDPTIAGTGLKWFVVVGMGIEGRPIMGLDFMRELVRQEPVVLRDQRQQVEWLGHGKYQVVLAPLSGALADFMAAGAPIQLLTPEEGNYLTTGVGNIALIDRATHPNSARVFINWLLTKEAQTLFSRGNDVQSGRIDVPSDHLSPAKVRDPKVKYVWSEVEESLLKEPEYSKLAKEIFGPLVK